MALLWGGTPADGGGQQLATVTGDYITVVVRREAWGAEFPPPVGAVFDVPEIGQLHCRHVQTTLSGWQCLCVHDMRAGQ